MNICGRRENAAAAVSAQQQTPGFPASCEELETRDAADDKPDAAEADRGRRLLEQNHAQHRRSDRADPGPDRVGGADRQIAQRLNISDNTVKKQMSNALRILRSRLGVVFDLFF